MKTSESKLKIGLIAAAIAMFALSKLGGLPEPATIQPATAAATKPTPDQTWVDPDQPPQTLILTAEPDSFGHSTSDGIGHHTHEPIN